MRNIQISSRISFFTIGAMLIINKDKHYRYVEEFEGLQCMTNKEYCLSGVELS